MTVQANTDDPETALKVILTRSGTSAEREAASKPVEEGSIVTASAEDLKNPHTTVARETTSGSHVPADSDPDGARPTLRRNIPPSTPNDETEASGAWPVDPVISDAREVNASFTAELPNFLVQQLTTRYRSNYGPSNWIPMDVVTSEVAVVDGKEDYRNILVNGRPPQGGVERTGSWSTGEFAITLEDILSPATAAVFVKRGEDAIATRPALVYNLSVQQENSHWIIVSPDGRKYRPAYSGAIWIDKETRRVLRIEQRAIYLPNDYMYNKAETALEYGFVSIDGKSYLLPLTSENVGCMRGTGNCVRNVIEFRNHRHFSADSDIKFEKFASN